MRKALLLAFIFGLACCIAACSTTNVGLLPAPGRVVSGSFAVETEPGVGVYTPALSVAEGGGDAVVTVSAVDAVDLAAAYLHVKYDSTKYSPERVEIGDFLGSSAEIISLTLTDRPDEVPVGIAQVAFNGAVPKDGSGVLAVVHFKATPFAGNRVVSGAPSGTRNKVELALVDQTANSADLHWTERDAGDYNNNGRVGITDLTPLAILFGQSVASAADPVWAALVDGNGDGLINISDLTPIGQNYGDGLDGYLVYIDAASSVLYDGSGIHAARPSPAAINPKVPVTYDFTASFNPGDTPQYSVRPVLSSDLGHPGPDSNHVGLLVDEPGPPAAPANLAANSGQSIGVGRVNLDWTQSTSTDVLKYDIHRKLSSGSTWALIAQVPGSASTYSDSDPALTDDDYDYRILARDLSDQTSGWSNTPTAHPYYPPPPEPPTNLTATAGQAIGEGVVQLSWDLSPSPSIIAYEIERKLSSGSTWAKIGEVGSTLDAYTDSDPSLTAAPYDYHVLARNTLNQKSNPGNTATATPWYPPTLDPPLNPSAVPSTSKALAIDVRWDKPANGYGTGFRVYRKAPGEGSFSPLSPDIAFDLNPLKLTDEGLQEGQTYEYYIKTLDGAAESAPTATVNSIPSTSAQPIQILDVTTDKTTHCSDGSENAAQLAVVTDPDPADSYSWTGPGTFSSTSIKNPTWKPDAATPLGKATLSVTVTLGPNNDTATIDMYVTQQPIVTEYTGLDSVSRQVGSPPGSGIAPDFNYSGLQYLEPLIDGGDITAASGTFYGQIAGQVVLFDRWELW